MVNDFMQLQGVTCGDLDGDGDLDVVIAGGAVGTLVYRNDGEWDFVRITNNVLSQVKSLGITPSIADYDNNGFLDLYVPRAGGEAKLLYRNDGNGNHWLLVKLVGTRSNRYAIGAKVHAGATISGKTFTQLREINGGNRAQGDVRAHFGLGDATSVTSLTIKWPSGSSETLSNVPPTQPSGSTRWNRGRGEGGTWQRTR